VTAFKIRS